MRPTRNRKIEAIISLSELPSLPYFSMILGNVAPELLGNVFCPTGQGGGIDPTCSPGKGTGGVGTGEKITKDTVRKGRNKHKFTMQEIAEAYDNIEPSDPETPGRWGKTVALGQYLNKNAKDGVFQRHGMTNIEKMKYVEVDGVKIAWSADMPNGFVSTSIMATAGMDPYADRVTIPDSVKKANKLIILSNQRNRDDAYWEEKYKIKDFKAIATGGDGEIVVYNRSPLGTGTYAHESGHNIAEKIWKTTTPPETSNYGKAQKLERPVSTYGKNSPSEDFAEAVRMYVTEKDKLKTKFPKKYEALRELLEGSVTGNTLHYPDIMVALSELPTLTYFSSLLSEVAPEFVDNAVCPGSPKRYDCPPWNKGLRGVTTKKVATKSKPEKITKKSTKKVVKDKKTEKAVVKKEVPKKIKKMELKDQKKTGKKMELRKQDASVQKAEIREKGNVFTSQEIQEDLKRLSGQDDSLMSETGRAELGRHLKMNAKETKIQAHGMSKKEEMLSVEIDGVKVAWNKNMSDVDVANSVMVMQGISPTGSTYKIPENLKKANREVIMSEQKNKDDPHWAQEYNDPNFVSTATGAYGKIVYYNGAKPSVDTFSHESGHNLATKAWGSTFPPQWSKYSIAQAKEKPVTKYGRNSTAEDFAEAVRLYVTSPIRLKYDFPEKYKAIDELLK